MKSSTGRALVWTSGLAELALATFAARSIGRDATFPVYFRFYLAMSVPWLVATYAVVRGSPGKTESGAGGRLRGELVAVLALGAILRFVFLSTDPALSDDVFRYVWDGEVQRAGINPYRYPPDAPDLAFLRDGAVYPGINNKDIPTIYPPLMQMAFALATSISERITWMKAFFVVADLGLMLALAGLLTLLRMDPMRCLVYGWSPLSIIEVAASGHNDVLAVLFLFVALWAFARGRTALSFVLLSFSGLSKLMGFALAPLFVRFVRPRLYLIPPVLGVALSLPYASAGTLAFRGLEEYGTRWRANDGLFHLLYAITGSLASAKLVAAALLLVLAAGLVWNRTPPIRGCYWFVGALLLLMPTVHPWYLLWMLPFLAIYPNPAWLYLTVSVALSYHAPYLATQGVPWRETLWVKWVEYLPFFLLLGLDLALDESRQGASDSDRGGAR